MNDALGGVQTVLVLGGTSELALATLQALDLRPGATLALAGRDVARLEQAGAGLKATVHAYPWDASNPAAGPALVQQVAGDLGDLDLVVAAAGVLGDQERAEADPGYAADVLTTNFVGVAAPLLAAAQRLRRQGHGVLVVFSSVAGLRGRRANFVYGASKAGLDALAEGLAASLAGSGVRLVLVRPGFVRGRMTAGMPAAPMATTPEAVGAAVAAAVASGKGVVHVPRKLGPVFAALRLLPAPVFRRLPG